MPDRGGSSSLGKIAAVIGVVFLFGGFFLGVTTGTLTGIMIVNGTSTPVGTMTLGTENVVAILLVLVGVVLIAFGIVKRLRR
jgi:hypothetical protein